MSDRNLVHSPTITISTLSSLCKVTLFSSKPILGLCSNSQSIPQNFVEPIEGNSIKSTKKTCPWTFKRNLRKTLLISTLLPNELVVIIPLSMFPIGIPYLQASSLKMYEFGEPKSIKENNKIVLRVNVLVMTSVNP